MSDEDEKPVRRRRRRRRRDESEEKPKSPKTGKEQEQDDNDDDPSPSTQPKSGGVYWLHCVLSLTFSWLESCNKNVMMLSFFKAGTSDQKSQVKLLPDLGESTCQYANNAVLTGWIKWKVQNRDYVFRCYVYLHRFICMRMLLQPRWQCGCQKRCKLERRWRWLYVYKPF